MADLRTIIKENNNIIIEGIAWVVIYKDGRSWNCDYFYPESGSYDEGYTFSAEDIEKMEEIAKKDHKAICINGYYMGFGEDFNLKEMEDKVLWMYENWRNQLKGDFLDCFVVNKE